MIKLKCKKYEHRSEKGELWVNPKLIRYMERNCSGGTTITFDYQEWKWVEEDCETILKMIKYLSV